jgi:homoserine kinase type II
MTVIELSRVLTEYPSPVTMAQWTPLGSAGGFSGARVWRGTTADGRELCLKAHPPGAEFVRLERLIHGLMSVARWAGSEFVPLVECTRRGRTVVEAADRVWDVTEWKPGKADFHARSTDERLVAAVEAVARLHAVWAKHSFGPPAPCPAVNRRWAALRDWEVLVASGWRPQPAPDDPVAPHVEVIWPRLPGILPPVLAELAQWRDVLVPVQPCLCDVWHDHVLFTGDRVTGLIDYGAAKTDHVAVDLARLLGSLVPGERNRWELALGAYRTIRLLPQPELAQLLDWTGVVVGVTNWLRWLYRDGRTDPDRNAVAARVAALVRRLSP